MGTDASMPGWWHLQADQLSWGEQGESSLHHLTKPLAQTIWCEGARGGVSGSYIINGVTSNLHGCHMYLGICGTASNCHAEYFAWIHYDDRFPGVLMSWWHSWQMGAVHQRLTQAMTGSVEWQHRDRQITPVTVTRRPGLTRPQFVLMSDAEWSVDSLWSWIFFIGESSEECPE